MSLVSKSVMIEKGKVLEKGLVAADFGFSGDCLLLFKY